MVLKAPVLHVPPDLSAPTQQPQRKRALLTTPTPLARTQLLGPRTAQCAQRVRLAALQQ